MFFTTKENFIRLFFTNLFKLDPDLHSEKLLDPVPQKINVDCGSIALESAKW